jgi:hypothetical protein
MPAIGGAMWPLPQEQEVRLLAMVDVLESLSKEELEGLAQRHPDILLEEGGSSTPQGTAAKGSSSSSGGGCASTGKWTETNLHLL